MIAAVGQRMIQAASRQIVGQFFQAFAKQIQEGPAS
jgi:carbon monoxide dehydrogenase subunit G